MSKVYQGAGVLTITQVKSAIGRKPGQKETLVGLGLNKLHKTSTLEGYASNSWDDRQSKSPFENRR